MTKDLRCIGNNILVLLPEIDDKTAAGIIKSPEMLEEEEGKLHIVKVVSTGEEVTKVKEGDEVILAVPSVAIINYEGIRYGGLTEYGVFCVVEKEETKEAVKA